jgi:inositol-phosphate phosphatase/L-galactose 1-phosphate phosphatase/histidinol-phosphatase
MEAFTAFAIKLADRAGSLARESFYTVQGVSQKADNSLVTETDKAIETALRDMIAAEYPEHGIYGEEHGRTNPGASYQWVIDPIDGTNAFIAGIPTFTTLIALTVDGVPVLGLIDQPILQERLVSSQLTPHNYTALLANSIVATTSMAYFTPMEIDRFTRLRKHCAGTIHAGDAYLYAKLARGTVGVVVDACLKPYDFCALRPVVEAAGGIITDWQGKPLHMHSDGTVVAAANQALHTQALRLLND